MVCAYISRNLPQVISYFIRRKSFNKGRHLRTIANVLLTRPVQTINLFASNNFIVKNFAFVRNRILLTKKLSRCLYCHFVA